MGRRRRRQALAAAAIAVIAGAAIAAAVTPFGSTPVAAEGEVPSALGKHLEALRQAMPGNQGMANEGPASAADDAFAQRAYPDDTIAASDVQAARSAFSTQQGRPFQKGKGRPGTWVTIGPSKALYPFTEFRNAFN